MDTPKPLVPALIDAMVPSLASKRIFFGCARTGVFQALPAASAIRLSRTGFESLMTPAWIVEPLLPLLFDLVQLVWINPRTSFNFSLPERIDRVRRYLVWVIWMGGLPMLPRKGIPASLFFPSLSIPRIEYWCA